MRAVPVLSSFHRRLSGNLPRNVLPCSLVLALVAAHALVAQPVVWEEVGPGDHAIVTALGAAPSKPGRVYAGTNNGVVFSSDDAGVTWDGRGSLPQPTSETRIVRLDVSPTNPDLVFAIVRHRGAFVSADGGATWEPFDGPFRSEVFQIVVVPGTPFFESSTILALWGQPGLWRSQDGGRSWGLVPAPTGGSFSRVVQDPDDPSILWTHSVRADPRAGPQVFRSDDGGATWVPAFAGLPERGAFGVPVLGGEPGRTVLLVLVDDHRLFASSDGGRTWHERKEASETIRELNEEDEVFGLVADTVDPDLLYLRTLQSRLLVSRDGGATFEVATSPATDLLLPLPGRSGEALLGGHSGVSLWGATGGATTFEPREEGLDAQTIRGAVFPEGSGVRGLVVASSASLWRSTDRGVSWERLRDHSASDLTAVPGAPGLLYGLGGTVGRSEDGGETWEFGPPGSTGCIVPETLAVASSEPETVLTSGRFRLRGCVLTAECALFESTDGGRTFSCVRGNLHTGIADALLFDPRDVETAYLARTASSDILRTRDGGELWQPVREGLPATVLAVSPRAPEVIWAGTSDGEVWKSPDRGDTWFQTPSPIPESASPPEVLSLTLDPRDPETLYAVLEGTGVFVTRDAGTTWKSLGEEVSPDSEVSGALAVDPSDPRWLFAGTVNQGVFRLLQIDTSPCVPDATTLCLHDGRFEVEVAWEDFQGGQGVGHAMPETGDSGWFWFFDPDNVELLVKVIDGREVNDNFWFFYGALSNVGYTITVRDTDTGEVKTYPNPSGRFASVGDTAAFPLEDDEPGTAGEATSTGAAAVGLQLTRPVEPVEETTSAADTCEPDATTLCLQDGRFRVRVEWRDFQGGEGEGRAVPLVRPGSTEPADDSGFFWFFEPDNLELVVKVIDGRTVNGNFWFFYGALSNVEYRIEVVDVDSGRRAVFENPARRFASFGDTGTFDGSALCGGIAGFPCLEGQVCDPAPGSCQVADVGGRCRVRPQVCPTVFEPVCGCDGRTYSNDCERLRAGVAKDHDGVCAADQCGGTGGLSCGEDRLCDLVPGSCGSADADPGGVCVDRPEACPADFVPVCGCDGVTYGNDCDRQRAGVSKDHDGPCAGQLCGTIAGIPCADDQICEFPVGSCEVSDAPGLCVTRPEACLADFRPVCGCDGRTYSNDCTRLRAGVTKAHDGECEGGE